MSDLNTILLQGEIVEDMEASTEDVYVFRLKNMHIVNNEKREWVFPIRLNDGYAIKHMDKFKSGCRLRVIGRLMNIQGSQMSYIMADHVEFLPDFVKGVKGGQ